MNLTERLEDIIRRKAEGVEAMKQIMATAEAEGRDMTEQEEANFSYLDKEVQKLKRDEIRTRNLADDDADLQEPQRRLRTYITPNKNAEEFKSLGEFIYSVRFRPSDERLREHYTELESREQSMGVGVEGGFAVPTQFAPQLRMVEPQAAIFRPRCTVIAAGDPPDAAISMPTLDQTSASNIYGGMTVNWISEGATKPETDLALKEVTLTPHEVAGYTVLTDKLLRNWAAADSLITGMLRQCILGAEDTAFLSGTGVGRPLGVINSPAAVNYVRATAGTIALADIQGMYARAKFGGSLVWVTSQTTLPQLTNLVDAASNLIWMPNKDVISGPPGTLFGIPVMLNDRSPALGSTGDLMLLDLSYYLIKDGSGPLVAASPHVYFTANKTVIKVFWNVDGQPWLTEPIPLEGSTANTVSPFVILN